VREKRSDKKNEMRRKKRSEGKKKEMSGKERSLGKKAMRRKIKK